MYWISLFIFDEIMNKNNLESLPSAWHPGLEDGVPEEWKEGDQPPEPSEDVEEPDVPDPNMEGMPTIWGYEDCDFDKSETCDLNLV